MTQDFLPSDEEGAAGSARSGRVRSWVGRGRTWTTEERTRVEDALASRREHSNLIGAGFDIAELDVHVGGGILAGAVAFRLFLFMVPFVYILFTAVGLASTAANQDPATLAKTLGITGVLASAVVNSQDISVLSQFLLVLGASVALLWTANGLVKTLYIVHWLIWGVPRLKPRGFRTIGTTIGLAVVLTVLAVATNVLRTDIGRLVSLLVALIVMAVAFAAWWWVSWRLPHAPVRAQQLCGVSGARDRSSAPHYDLLDRAPRGPQVEYLWRDRHRPGCALVGLRLRSNHRCIRGGQCGAVATERRRSPGHDDRVDTAAGLTRTP